MLAAVKEFEAALAPHAHSLVSSHRYPRHANRIVAAFGDAVFFAAAGVRMRQYGNAFGDFEALDAAHLDAPAASCAFVCCDDWNPLGFHGSDRPLAIHAVLRSHDLYFTTIVPFIHGCGAH